MSLFDLSGKVAVVTGGSRGIGRATAERLAEHGARVVVSSRKAEACETVAAAIRGHGGEAMVAACDITKPPDLQKLVAETEAAWGRIDILVCNAAVNPHFGTIIDASDAAYEATMDGNLRSTMRLAHLVLPGMAARGEGAIIVIGSIAGMRGALDLGIYGISKAAEMQFVRSLAVEWGPRGIRANAIAPGLVRTDFARALWENKERLAARESETPLNRIGDPDDIAGAAVFLAAPASRLMTGQTIVVDGGFMVGAPRK